MRLYTFVFNFNYDTTPLWYLYMLVGLYLVMPVLGAWLRQASQRDLQLFLAVWGAALLLPYVEVAAPLLGYAGNGGNMGLWGVCDWNAYGTFYYFSGFVGYLVLAYYLVRYPLRWSLAADARRNGAALRGRLPHNGAGLRRHAEPVSG